MKFLLIVPTLFLCVLFPKPTNAWTDPITIDIMSTVASYLPSYGDTIPQFFPDIMGVADLYATVTSYTRYSCPLKWIIRTRGRYIDYYTEIQQRINDTRDRVLANYTFWSENFNQTGDSVDQGLTQLQDIMTQNQCDAEFVTQYLDTLKQNMTLAILRVNDLQQYYQLVAGTIPVDLPYAFPNELIKALTRQSIMSYGDLGRAVHYAEFLHYFEDRRIIFQALETIEWALNGFHYSVFHSTRRYVEHVLEDAILHAISYPCVM